MQGCGGCDVCCNVDGCWVDLFGAFLCLLGMLVVVFFVTFAGKGSGSWYCAFRLNDGDDDVPICDPFIFDEFGHTARRSGKLKELSML